MATKKPSDERPFIKHAARTSISMFTHSSIHFGPFSKHHTSTHIHMVRNPSNHSRAIYVHICISCSQSGLCNHHPFIFREIHNYKQLIWCNELASKCSARIPSNTKTSDEWAQMNDNHNVIEIMVNLKANVGIFTAKSKTSNGQSSLFLVKHDFFFANCIPCRKPNMYLIVT